MMYQGWTPPTDFEEKCKEQGKDPQIEAEKIQLKRQEEKDDGEQRTDTTG